jgi:hypothetical protein
MEAKVIGNAKRVRVEMPMGAQRSAWDCRKFGLGRIVTPKLPVRIELAPGMLLDVATGEILSRRHTRTLAA